MATYPCFHLLLALVLFTTASLGAQVFTVSFNLSEIEMSGRLYCTPTGNPELERHTNQGIAGVNMSLSCDGRATSPGLAITDSTGTYRAEIKPADGQTFDPTSCVATATLPIPKCPLLPTNGNLQARANFLRIAASEDSVLLITLMRFQPQRPSA